MGKNYVKISGARTHNLKNIDVEIPKNKLVVVTGLSGSGKSSLVIDTLFSYSRKIYLEALSSKNFIIDNVDFEVDYIQGAQPPVALEQTRGRYGNPRSTVGTLSGIEGYLRVFFAKKGQPACPVCFGPTDKERFCSKCGCFAEPLVPQNFNSNHKEGMCLACSGIGRVLKFIEDKVAPDKNRTLDWIWDHAERNTFAAPSNRKIFNALCADEKIPRDVPYRALSEKHRNLFLYGSEKKFSIKINKVINETNYQGIINYLDVQYRKTTSVDRRKALENYLSALDCDQCTGGKLRREILAVRISGKNYADVQNMELDDFLSFIGKVDLDDKEEKLLKDTINEIKNRTNNICRMNIGYLSFSRPLKTLSGGELQRLLISQHIASDLTGVMYILDEPSIGLHEMEVHSLIEMLKRLRDLGNSLVIIEHDEKIINAADWIIEIGPGAGEFGGKLLAAGTIAQIKDNPNSITSRYLINRSGIRKRLEDKDVKRLKIKNVTRNNLKNMSVAFPLNRLVCVTGVSGAGKSTLIEAIYDEMLSLKFNKKKPSSLLEGFENIDDVIYVDQKPIGISSRSNTATYIGIYDYIRELFSGLPEAKSHGFDKSHFSVNVPGGRCETCKGQGYVEIDMHFLKSENVLCDECGGKQFRSEVLAVTYKNKNIHEVLMMSVAEALKYFGKKDDPKIFEGLALLNDFGLGYFKLGQSTSTFSGGEAQRINLITELLKIRRNNTLFIFDEPTTGLHFADIQYLTRLFDGLINTGNSVLIIEHNLDIIFQADHLIDLGPGGGKNGGRVVYAGSVEGLLNEDKSYTGKYLKEHLGQYYKLS